MKLRKRNLLVVLAIASFLAIPVRALHLGGGYMTSFVLQETDQQASDQTVEDHGAVEQEHAEEEETLDPVHHNSDAVYLDFEPFGKLQLPRIFLVRREDGSTGVDFFGSTTAAVEEGGYIASLEEGEHGTVLDAHLEPAVGEVLIDFSITKHLVFAWLGALIVLLLFTSLARMYRRGIGRETAPRGLFQNMMESLVLFVRDEIARPILREK